MATRIRRLGLVNWRNFRNVEVALGQRAFVVGPNASGKTNLLDALRFLRDIARPGGSLVGAIRERSGFKHVRSLHAGNSSNVVVDVDIEIDGDDAIWSYHLEISGSETRQKPLRIVHERVRHGTVAVLDRSAGSEKDARLLSQTALEQASQSLEFTALVDALASLRHVHVVPQVARTEIRADEISKRDAPGSDFIDQLARLPKKRQGAVLRKIERQLRSAVPRLSHIRVERDEIGKPHLQAKYAHWRDKGGWQDERDFSDGTLRLIGLLWAIIQDDAPLLLEEPELSLHRDVIRQLPRLFANVVATSGRQIIVSTHAEEMLLDTGIAPDEIIVLTPSEHETRVSRGDQIPELRQAAEARVPLGRTIVALTRPPDIEQLSLQLVANGRP